MESHVHAHGPLLVAALERLERLDGVSEQGRPPHNAHLGGGVGARRGGQRHGIRKLIGDSVAPPPLPPRARRTGFSLSKGGYGGRP